MGEKALSLRNAQLWLRRFRANDYEIEDSPISGRARVIDINELKAVIEEDPRQTTRCLAERFSCCHTTIETYLGELGKSYKYGLWIPHQLNTKHLNQRVDMHV